MPGGAGSDLRLIARRLGWRYVPLWLCAAFGRRLSLLHLFIVTTHPIDDEQRHADVNTAGLETRLLTPDEISRFFDRDEGFAYVRAFAADALSRGHRCFGVLDRGRLLWYGWYARGPAPVFDDVEVVVDFPFQYAYNVYTDEAHRGRGLHRMGVTASGRAFAREGYRAFTAYIDADNLAPLIAARSMGERVAGFAVVHRVFGRVRWFATHGCRRAGFRLHRRSH
jgi:hypothetical protein